MDPPRGSNGSEGAARLPACTLRLPRSESSRARFPGCPPESCPSVQREGHVPCQVATIPQESGRPAAPAARETPGVFTLKVTGLQPDQEVTVETAYVQLARPAGGGWSLRIPLTVAPRFVRNDEQGSRAPQGQPLALARDPGHRF